MAATGRGYAATVLEPAGVAGVVSSASRAEATLALRGACSRPGGHGTRRLDRLLEPSYYVFNYISYYRPADGHSTAVVSGPRDNTSGNLTFATTTDYANTPTDGATRSVSPSELVFGRLLSRAQRLGFAHSGGPRTVPDRLHGDVEPAVRGRRPSLHAVQGPGQYGPAGDVLRSRDRSGAAQHDPRCLPGKRSRLRLQHVRFGIVRC